MADRTDWHQLAETVSFPTLAIIDGRKVPAVSGETFASVNPATGKVLAEVAACDGRDIDLAAVSSRACGATARRPSARPCS
jgi:acyl-CoA reductase-like NAD-dependent aldehyde dehydrogenase